MRYWGLLAAKLFAAAFALKGLWWLIARALPPPKPFMRVYQPRFPYDLWWTLAVGVFFLICCGVGYLIYLDQRYRCRVCARRLRMPLEKGSWSAMLQFGKPRLEYICPYGHGTLQVPELHLTGIEHTDWNRHDDIWKELFPAEKPRP